LCYTALWTDARDSNPRDPRETQVGFIGYRFGREGNSDEVVRIFLECREETPAETARNGLNGISYTYAVDVVFPGGRPPCRLRGVDGVLVLKKFYKLVNSLEERAREHGNDRHQAMDSVQGLLEHLAYTRNARDLAGSVEPRRRVADEQDVADQECLLA
jgi:hypothetical protein